MKKVVAKNKLETAMAQIEKLYGKGSLIEYGKGTSLNISSISTGSFLVDEISGIGGVPVGRITEIYGPESSGKTTLCLHMIAEAQKMGKRAAFIDAEHALDPVYAKNIGVNMNKLLLSQPDYGEQALDIASKLIETSEVGIIVIDSVAALVPKSEIEGDIGDSHMALQARMMSQSLRMINGAVKKSNTALIFINQLRSKIGIMFGNPEITTGGNALKFYASMRIDIRRIGAIKDGENIVGNRTRVKISKSKVSAPFKTCEIEIRYGEGVDNYSELIELGIKYGFIEKLGAWYVVTDKHRYQGKEKVKQALKSNIKLYNYLKKKLFGE